MDAQKHGLPMLSGFNHVAYRCRDAEQTRWFYEDVLGLPLAAALVLEEVPGLGDKYPYMHLFFRLGNGEFLAFFDDPQNATIEHFKRAHSFDRHVALETESEEALLAWCKAINSRGVTCLGPVDHGFVKSVYMYDPNGLQVEITFRTAAFSEIMAEEERGASEAMAQWTARTRDEKVRKFGAESLTIRKPRQDG